MQLLRPAIHALLVLLCLAGLSGCQSYQLGHPSELEFDTIFVKPATNDSYAPQAQALISSEVREKIIRDGRVELISKEREADVILYITLSNYSRVAGTRDQSDTEVAQDYDLNLEVTVSLYDQRSGKYLIESRSFKDRTIAYVENPFPGVGGPQEGLVQSERQAMPRLARDLGRRIVDEVLGAW